MEQNPVRIEELLVHAGWVRRLATRLVRDAGTADDVAQEVWAQALRSPPRERTNLRAWLSAAVRNAARSLQRSESRRARRESAVAGREDSPAAADLVERAHLHRELVEYVIELGEPHRSIVLSHWFEERSLAEIARRLELTERVARSRLDEAHAILRRRMDASHGGRETWSLAFVGGIESTLASTAASPLTGGLVVANKLAVAVVAVLVVGLGWMLWPRAETPTSASVPLGDARTHDATTDARAVELASRPSETIREGLASNEPTRIAASVAGSTSWWVRGHVRGAPTERSSETKLTARFVGAYDIPDEVVGRPTADGSFEFEVTNALQVWLRSGDPHELELTADHPLCRLASVRVPFASATTSVGAAGAERRIFDADVELLPGAVVTGTLVVPADFTAVLGWGNRPLRPGVALFDLSGATPTAADVIDRATCDAHGRWTLRADRGGTFTVIASVDGLRPTATVVALVLGRSLDVGALELSRGATISGRVLRVDRPIGAGAEVVAYAKLDGRTQLPIGSSGPTNTRLIPFGGSFEHAVVHATTGADGSYELSGLAPIEYALEVGSLPGMKMSVGDARHVERTVLAPSSGVDLRQLPPTLELAVTVEGRAPTADEVEGLVLRLIETSGHGRAMEVDLTRHAGGYGKIRLATQVGYELRVPDGRFAPSVFPIDPPRRGEELRLSVDLKPRNRESKLVVSFVAAVPDDLEWSSFAFVESSATTLTEFPGVDATWLRIRRSPDGRFVLPHRAPGTYRVHVLPFDPWSPHSSYFVPTEFDVSLPASTTVARDVRLEIGGRIRVSVWNERTRRIAATAELRDATGQVLPTDFLCLHAGGLVRGGASVVADGPNDHPPLRAGTYELRLRAEGFDPETVSVDVTAGQTKALDVVLRPR